jgi:hypothetical protein
MPAHTYIVFILALGQLLAAAEPLSFNSDVRPILSNNCFRCHGPDDDDRKAKTRLDLPGEADLDEVLARISSTDPDEIMPPPESNKSLTPAQIDTLRRWIAEGANYEQHWAFVAPEKAPIPAGIKPIDHLMPASSPPADKLTLVRRVYLDLIGLPPTIEEADAFIADEHDGAFHRLVDRLLASPRYGERWARRWLDLARYADTNGYEKDRDRSIWPFRDWVIKAINADMPFDQFTVEQLAGDMLPGASPEQLTASGFHRNTMLNEEGGIDPLEFRFHAMTDRVATTGTTWLGLTTGCAQCHTHKFDPITHTDYYGLMAYLNNADEPDLILRDAATTQQHEKDLAEADRLVGGLADQWPMPAAEIVFHPATPISVTTTGQSLAEIDANEASVSITGPKPPTDTYTIVLESTSQSIGALRLETLIDPAGKGPGRTAHGNFVLTGLEIHAEPLDGSGDRVTTEIASASAEIEQAKYPVEGAFDDKPDSGWGIHDPQQPLNRDRAATFTFREAITYPGGARITVRLLQDLGGGHTIGRFRISLAPTPPEPAGQHQSPGQLARAAFENWLERERASAADWRPLIPVTASANFPYLVHEGEGNIFVGGDTSKHDIYSIEFAPQEEPITALRLEVLPDDRLPGRGPGTTFYEGRKGDFYLTEFVVAGSKIATATESYSKNGFGNSQVSAELATDGDIQTGWSVADRVGERHVAVFILEQAIPAGRAVDLEMHFGRHFASSLGKFRVSATSALGQPNASARDPEVERLLAKSPLTEPEEGTLFSAFLLGAPELETAATHIRKLRQPPAWTRTLVMQERPPAHSRATHLHHRGEFLSPKQVVSPRVPDAISPKGQPLPKDRLEFARWLVSGTNPLTARVVANRHWAAFFGEGIVKTLDDFGMQGELPSNQPLLDYLAVSLVEKGWSLKGLHREIVLSAAYRQQEFPHSRLEAEIIRDGSLRIAGLLSGKMFGPPVRPPQPAGVTEVAYGNPKWKASSGEDRYRRSIYTYQKRTAPFAMFTTFDGGSGEACIARRDRSNTPLQALTLMNDPMFIEIAEAFGKSISELPGDTQAKIHLAFRRTLTRPPDEAELAQLMQFHQQHQNWTALARILLSLDETITKP